MFAFSCFLAMKIAITVDIFCGYRDKWQGFG